MLGGDDLEQMLTVNIVDIADAAFTVDAGQRIVTWNSGAQRLLGYSGGEVLGHRCSEVLACDKAQAALCRSHCSLLGKPLRRPLPAVEVAVTTRDGKTRQIMMSTVMARTASGDSRIVHVLRDPHAVTPSLRSPSVAHDRTEVEAKAPPPEPASDDFGVQPHLTPRELEALRLLGRGLSTVEIAAALGVSRITARNHVTKVMDKLQVRTRLQAVVAASRLDLI